LSGPVIIAAGVGAFAHWLACVVACALERRAARRRLPINRFAGYNFPPPGDAGWREDGAGLVLGPVYIYACDLFCHGVPVEQSDRVYRYRKAIEEDLRRRKIEDAIEKLREFELQRAREMLS
jgi:hypothetical protein